MTFVVLSARADWRVDSGFFDLAAELGAAMPTGAGVDVLHVEAPDGIGAYLPEGGGPGDFAGTAQFAGKTFHPLSGGGAASGHAVAVGSYFYGLFGSMAPGVTSIHCLNAQDFFDHLSGLTTPITAYPGKVQNHSWIHDAGSALFNNRTLRRFDFALDRDRRIAAVGMNNGAGSATFPLLSASYHAIAVGLRDGQHNTGGTTTDGAGRMKPDLVVHETLTSLGCAGVASAAILLVDVALQSGVADADRPQVIKALLLAGASKAAIPAWKRMTTAKPYDEVLGAGELNLQRAWHIQAGGRHTFSTVAEVPPRGWSFDTATTDAAGRRYFFSVPAGRFADTFSAALTWHRTTNATGTTSTLPNLSLKLFTAVAFTAGMAPVDESISSVDNVEHVFLRHLPPGQYVLEVTSNTAGTEYALAWEARIGSGPRLSVTRDATEVVIGAELLDPFVTYTLQASGDLMQWDDVASVRTADTVQATTHGWTLPEPAETLRKYYRLSWPSIR